MENIKWLKELAQKGWLKIVSESNRKYEKLYWNGYYFNPVNGLNIYDLPITDIKTIGKPLISDESLKIIFD